jgi:hypothetical protein
MKGHGRRIVCIANPAPAIDAYQATPTIDGTQQLHILYSVIILKVLSRFKEIVRKIDSNAFVVVTDTLGVMGKRIGNQPHW